MSELKERKVIQSKNLVGELGEFMAISYYCKTPNLPNLKRADPSTKNIDAISRDGDRYTIKSTSSNTTGVFWGLNSPDSNKQDIQRFEYAIIVIFNEDYKMQRIIEINWEQFLMLKRWHSRMNAWNLTVNKKLMDIGRIVYKGD